MQVLEKVAKALSRNYGIKVRFQGTKAYTDYKSITLPMLPKDLEEADEIKVRGYCDHEISHLLNSDPEVTRKGFEAGPKINNMRNLLEDFRIERDIAKDYIGTRVNMERTAEYLKREGEQELKGEAPHIMTKLWIEGRRQVCGYKLDGQSYVVDLKAAFGDDVFDRMKAMGSGKSNAIDALNLAKQMVKDFEDKKEQQKQEQQKQQEAKDGDDNQDQGQGDGQDEQSDEAQDQQTDQTGSDQEDNRTGDSGDGDLDDSDDNGSGGSGGDDELPDTDNHDQDDQIGSGNGDEDQDSGETDEGGTDGLDNDDSDSEGAGSDNDKGDPESDSDDSGNGSDSVAGDNDDSDVDGDSDANDEADSGQLKIEDINDDVGDWADAMNKLQAEIERISNNALTSREPMPFSTAYDKIKFVKDDATMHTYSALKRKLGPLNMLKAKLVKLFLTSQVSRWVFDKEEGKINTRKLAGIKAGNRTVFKEKHTSQKIDTAVTLLCDFSGSMGVHGVKDVMAATIMFLEALKAAKVETEVLGFTTTGQEIPGVPPREANCNNDGKWARTECIITYIVKEFGEPFNAKVKRRISGASDFSRVPRRNNSDADNVLVAYERLRNQPQRRKIMFVLSDGYPNAKGNNLLKEKHLKQVVKDLEKAGVEMIGIGMGCDVSKFYPKNILIDGTEDIAKTMYGELKKLLKK